MIHRTRKAWTLIAGAAIVVSACTSAATPAPATPAPATTAPTTAPEATPTPLTGCGVTVNADGSLAPLADGFPNQAITIFNIDDPGAPDGIYALALKSTIENNKLTTVSVNVVDRPDFGTYGTWEGLEFINNDAAGKDGYILAVATVPGATTDLLTTDVVAALGADIRKLNVILTTEYVPYAMTSRKGAPWGNSFEEMIKYAQEHPGELKYISRGPGSGLDTAFSNYQQVAGQNAGYPEGQSGIPVTEIIGGSHAEINAVLGSGEGDIAMTLSDVAKQFYDDGKVEVLTYSGNAPAPDPFEVPTAKEVLGIENDPWGQNRTLFGASEMDECHREWLVKLTDLAIGTPEFVEARQKVPGLTLTRLTREQLWELSEDAYDKACPILKTKGILDPGVIATNPC